MCFSEARGRTVAVNPAEAGRQDPAEPTEFDRSGGIRSRWRNSETAGWPAARTNRSCALLICDDEDAVPHAQAAFDNAETDATFRFAQSLEEALDRLRGRGPYEGASLSDLVPLDLDMDGEGGYEILEAIRDDPELKPLPVIALTTSTEREEVVRSYEAKANACLRKPIDEESFADVVSVVDQFWLQRVKLPPISR